MSLFFKIAFLNVLRNSRRTLITVLAIVFGCVSLIVFGGFVESMYQGLRENMIRSNLGHIQIYKKGYSEFGNIDPEKYLLSKTELQKIFSIVETQPEVEFASERLNFTGLLSNGLTSLGVFGVGMDADKEALMNSAVTIIEGEDLFPDDLESALVGEGLAKGLNVKVGDWMTILSATADGAMNAVDINIAGIISTGIKEIDDRTIRANLPHIQTLMYTDSVTRVVILLENTEDTSPVTNRLNQLFKDNQLDVEIKTWSDLAGFYHKVVKLFNNVFGFIKIIVMVIVVLGIANTMMMAVMERTTEIGTVRALGNTRREIISLFLIESAYLGIIGGVLGIAIGILAAKGITAANIQMPAPPGSTRGFPINITIVYRFLVEAMILGILASVLSSIYPALKAARLKIIDALRFV
jgi:putative ABC transport system permease protein